MVQVLGVEPGQTNDETEWIDIDLSGLATEGIPVPFKLVGKRFKSSSPDSEDFIHDPLSVLRNVNLESLAQVDETWRVMTLVVNHEKTLSRSHTYAVVAAKEGGSGVIGTMLIKEPPASS